MRLKGVTGGKPRSCTSEIIVRRGWIARWKKDNVNGGTVKGMKEVPARGRRDAAENL